MSDWRIDLPDDDIVRQPDGTVDMAASLARIGWSTLPTHHLERFMNLWTAAKDIDADLAAGLPPLDSRLVRFREAIAAMDEWVESMERIDRSGSDD